MQRNDVDDTNTSTWLSRKVDELGQLLNSSLDRESELVLMQQAKRIATYIRATGVTLQVDNPRLARLLDNVS